MIATDRTVDLDERIIDNSCLVYICFHCIASTGAVALPDGRVLICAGVIVELAEGGRVSIDPRG